MAENIRVVCSLRKDLSQGLFSCIPLSKRTQRGRLRPAHIARPRGATPRPRSGAEAGRTPCPRGGSQEESPHVRGQGQRPRVPGCDGAGTARGATPRPKSGAAAERRYPASEVRGGSRECQAATAQEHREELPHVRRQGRRRGGATPRRAVAAPAQEGLEELFHVPGQEGRR